MRLALPVEHPDQPGHVLLRPGFELDAPALVRLSELRVATLWIRYPGLDELMKYVSPAVHEQLQGMTRVVGSLIDAVSADSSAALDFTPYAHAVRGTLALLMRDSASQLLVHEAVSRDRALGQHSTAVCFLSLLMGLKLEAYLVEQRRKLHPTRARSVESLGVGALLHDIGVLRLPPAVVERYRRTGDESDPEWQSHVRLGYELVRGKIEPTAAAAILQHHQRYDGKGYPTVPLRHDKPRGLIGEEIHVFARVISVADLFDRLRHGPASATITGAGTAAVGGPTAAATRDESPPALQPTVRVLNLLLQAARRREIDPVVFKALVHVAPPYPPGTLVTLNTDQTAVVTGFDPLEPCRPMVRCLRGPGDLGAILNRPDPTAMLPRTADTALADPDMLGERLDLRTRYDLAVVRAEGQGVMNDNFSAQDPTEFDLRLLAPPPQLTARAALKKAVA